MFSNHGSSYKCISFSKTVANFEFQYNFSFRRLRVVANSIMNSKSFKSFSARTLRGKLSQFRFVKFEIIIMEHPIDSRCRISNSNCTFGTSVTLFSSQCCWTGLTSPVSLNYLPLWGISLCQQRFPAVKLCQNETQISLSRRRSSNLPSLDCAPAGGYSEISCSLSFVCV